MTAPHGGRTPSGWPGCMADRTDGYSRVPVHRPTLSPTLWVAALLLVVLTAACGGDFPQSSRRPQSDVARSIDDLFRGIFWLAVGVFVVVEGALLVTIVRFRERPGAGSPKPVHGNTAL